MSHHLDTPLAAQTGQLYIDDLYVFPGEGSTVFVMDVNSNVNGLHSEPGFHPEARYEFKVHFDGADFETLTYRVSFGEADSGGQQALQLHVLTGDDPVLRWIRGTGLRPVITALAGADRDEFLTEYGGLLREAYPEASYGTAFPFRRVFVVAHKP